MKTCLFVVCALVVAAVVVHGDDYYANDGPNSEQQFDEWLSRDATDTLEKMQDEVEDSPVAADSPIIQEDIKKNKSVVDEHGCDCDDECDKLHYSHLPHDVRDPHKYLSYENFPVLCRDAAAILLPVGKKPQKKYVCKSVFNCCRFCNFHFYVCLKNSNLYSYGFCIRGAYKCMCDCIERKGYGELKYLPVPH